MAVLLAHKLCKNFQGLEAVKDFDLACDPGELVGLIGPNGAGKTTVFNLLTGVYHPTSGRIIIDGQDVTGKRPDLIMRQGMARTFQSVRLFGELTVLDNLRIACHSLFKYNAIAGLLNLASYEKEERANDLYIGGLMEEFDLTRYGDQKAGGLPYVILRRLELARAMAARPRVLLLDEPTAGMNDEEREAYIGLLQRIRSKNELAVLLIEHDMQLIMGVCESVLVMDYGKIIAQGTPDQVQHDERVLAAYLGVEISA